MATRDINDLTIDAKRLLAEFAVEMGKRGVAFIITSVKRTKEEQIALWLQGRVPVDTVNAVRKAAGLAPITQERNRVVTWTMNSRHLPLTEDDVENGSAHPADIGKSRAFDIAIITQGRACTWDTKADIDNDGKADYQEAAEAGRAAGLICGADFKNRHGQPNPDWCHFEAPRRA